MDEKKYLKGYQKVAYGSGDLACNLCYGLVTSFVLIYLTNTIGLNSAIIGTLMLASKLLDGVTDIFFGVLIDRTKSKLGKARPWMLYAQIGITLTTIMMFAIPAMPTTMQYVYFFIAYTAYNAIFLTANNIAYAALSALITRNKNERVQLGSIRFMFAVATNILIPFVTVGMVEDFGGGAQGWRMVAIIFSVGSLIFNTISCLSVKELPEEQLHDEKGNDTKENKLTFKQNAKYLVGNKYYLMIVGIYILQYTMTGITQGVAIYYTTYVLGDASLLGTFSMIGLIPVIISLSLTPFLVKKFKSMWRVNTIGYSIGLVMSVFFIIAALNQNIPFMLITMAIKGLCMGPMTGSFNALIAETSAYTYRKDGVHMDGVMFSCSAFGIKIGGGIGSALAGLLLSIGGFDGMAAAQTAGAINMITFMYVGIPFIVLVLMTILLFMLNVEKANKDWDKAHGVTE